MWCLFSRSYSSGQACQHSVHSSGFLETNPSLPPLQGDPSLCKPTSLVSHPSSARLCDVWDNQIWIEYSIQAFSRKDGMWAFIPRLETCALANAANSLQKISGGRLHSSKHRATRPVDGAKDQYFAAYLLRPSNTLISKWNAAKWSWYLIPVQPAFDLQQAGIVTLWVRIPLLYP